MNVGVRAVDGGHEHHVELVGKDWIAVFCLSLKRTIASAFICISMEACTLGEGEGWLVVW